MADEHNDEIDLDAGEIQRQCMAIAKHLSAAGVSFLPAANTDAVQRWTDRMGRAESQPPTAQRSLAEPATARPVTAEPTATDSKSDAPPVKPPPVAPPMFGPLATAYPPPLPVAERSAVLQAEASEVAGCTRCPMLSQCRKNTVYGEGNPEARFLFFGEGPGQNEDETGRPFVGEAGKLLDKMIVACKMRREDVYICNSVKCRPPGNRNPEPSELENCRPYFETQFETIQPEYIICLGAVAAQTLLETKATVGRLRGSLHTYRGSKVLVTYHPAYLLRNPKAKGAAWTDLKLAMADAGVAL